MDYYKNEQHKFIIKTERLLEELPSFCTSYYSGKLLKLSAKTQHLYATKIKSFLEFMITNVESFENKNISELTLDDFASISADNVKDYISFLSRSLSESSIYTHVDAVSSYYSYFIKCQSKLSDGSTMSYNPFWTIERTKKKKKTIIYLNKAEQNQLLSSVEYGEGLTDKQLKFHEKYALRDNCICQILLDTGIRVSELVGLNIDDINLYNNSMLVIRKGGNEDTVYYSDQTNLIIQDYLETREMYHPDETERALFLSSPSSGALKRSGSQRLSIRSVEKLVKKYSLASKISQGNKITPHKLRSSYAMESLEKTGNIKLVQKQLGHENITTTTIYADVLDKDKENNRNFRYEGSKNNN